jgi:hypothetical protein
LKRVAIKQKQLHQEGIRLKEHHKEIRLKENHKEIRLKEHQEGIRLKEAPGRQVIRSQACWPQVNSRRASEMKMCILEHINTVHDEQYTSTQAQSP